MNEELKQLGLTDNEISVYVTLLDIGENTVGPIIAKTKMHRQVAYDALAGLEKKDMIIKVSKNGRNNYRVSNPKNILENIKYQEKIANKLILEVGKRLGEIKKEQEIKIYEGAKAFGNLFIKNDENMPEGSEIYVLTAANKEFEKIMTQNNLFEKSNRLRLKKDIKIKLIYETKDRKDSAKIYKANVKSRFLSQGYSFPLEFMIWLDSVVITFFGSETFAIHIKNQKFRDSYLDHFNELWEMAKE